MSQPAIRVEGLSKRYRLGATEERNGYRTLRESITSFIKQPFKKKALAEDFWALSEVSFEIQPGEVVGIIGRNGAGKSTLLKILSRITKPTKGHIEINGRVGSLLEVGTGFHPELTGRENIYLNGSILGMSHKEIERKFDEIVAFAEIEKFLDTPVKRYSSGMYVRLAFAVAAQLEPEILVVDEVLAVGDAKFQKKCLGKMRDVGSQGRTVLFVSHQLGQIRALCTRGLWLEKGRLADSGPIAEVTERYLSSDSSETGFVIDLQQINRPSYNKSFRLTRLCVNGGKPAMHDEPFCIEMDYEATEPVTQLAFGFGFCTVEGTRLFSSDTDYDGQRYSLSEGRTGSVRLELNTLPLQPATYALDIGARTGDREALDYIPGCVLVEVLPGPRTPVVLIRHDHNGSVRVPISRLSWLGLEEQLTEAI